MQDVRGRDEAGIQHIDVFYLDLEGGGWFVALGAMDWSVTVNVWVLEFNPKDVNGHGDVMRLLMEKDYVREWDITEFCRDSLAERMRFMYRRIAESRSHTKS